MSLYIAQQLPVQDPELEMVLPVKGFGQTGWEVGNVIIYWVAKRLQRVPCTDIIPIAAIKIASELH